MKLKFIIPILILIILFIAGIFFISNKGTSIPGLNSCQIEASSETPVSLDLTKKVGINHVHLNNQPYNWTHIGSYPVYDALGNIYSHIHIFRKNDFLSLTTLEKLEQESSLYLDSSQEKSEVFFNNIATVITGAIKEDKLIQRHFRGVPEIVIKKIEVKKNVEENYPGKTIGRMISDSEAEPNYYEIVDKDSKKGSGKLININDLAIKSVSDLIKRQKEIIERRYASLSEKECQAMQQAVLESEKAHILEWGKFE